MYTEPLRWQEKACIAACVLAFLIPFVTDDRFVYSIYNQTLIGLVAAFGVYVMLRMNLLSFAGPAFMAIGGYATAIASARGVTDVFVLTALSFGVPALVALPLGALVLRLRGVYFVLVTFALAEITQLILFEWESLTGGANGIAGIPAATVFGGSLGDIRSGLLLAAALTLISALITVQVTKRLRQHFAAIEENDVLAESLGLVVWKYKVLGFMISAGLSGVAGFMLVSMLLTAHPSAFTSLSGVSYIVYVVVGGQASLLGPVVGSTVLVTASNLFSSQGEYSQGLFGVLIMIVVLAAKGGIVGGVQALLARRGRAPNRAAGG